jgi:hypothetical protein
MGTEAKDQQGESLDRINAHNMPKKKTNTALEEKAKAMALKHCNRCRVKNKLEQLKHIPRFWWDVWKSDWLKHAANYDKGHPPGWCK